MNVTPDPAVGFVFPLKDLFLFKLFVFIIDRQKGTRAAVPLQNAYVVLVLTWCMCYSCMFR